jgi:uncharacterized protein YbjT (DUF2867 family)
MYAILGATGHVGSVIANSLLGKGEKVRVVGRDSRRLDKFVRKGAEAVVANVTDAAALTKALAGVRAAFLMIPPNLTSQDYRGDQEYASDAIASAVQEAELRYAVFLSSIGGHVAAGTGPIAGLHAAEEKLNAVSALNVLHLRPAYFMENHLAGMGMIQGMGILGNALLPELKIAMIATRDIGDYAAGRMYALDFSGKQTRELLGERDLSMNETAAILARGIGKPDLRYVQFPNEQVQQVLTQMGIPVKTAAMFIEMYKAFNEGVVAAQERRSAENTTPTSLEKFVQEVFAPAYQGKAATA